MRQECVFFLSVLMAAFIVFWLARLSVCIVCAVCIEWQSFVMRCSVADESTQEGCISESERPKLARCNSPRFRSAPGMKMSWNLHQPAHCRGSSSVLFWHLTTLSDWKCSQPSIYDTCKPITLSTTKARSTVLCLRFTLALFAVSFCKLILERRNHLPLNFPRVTECIYSYI